MELPELHILHRDPGTRGHAHAVARVDEGVGRGGPDAACAARGQHRGLGLEDVHVAGFHFERRHAHDIAVFVAQEVKRHPFDEELRAGCQIALVEGMQQRVSGAIGRGTGTLHGLFAEVGRVAAKWALIDRAVRVAIEWHAEVFELVHRVSGLAAHELDGVLVTQPIRPLDGVVHVPVPVVFAHVPQRCADAALCGHRVRAGRKHLGQHCDGKPRVGELERATHTGTAGPHDHHVELATRQ